MKYESEAPEERLEKGCGEEESSPWRNLCGQKTLHLCSFSMSALLSLLFISRTISEPVTRAARRYEDAAARLEAELPAQIAQAHNVELVAKCGKKLKTSQFSSQCTLHRTSHYLPPFLPWILERVQCK